MQKLHTFTCSKRIAIIFIAILFQLGDCSEKWVQYEELLNKFPKGENEQIEFDDSLKESEIKQYVSIFNQLFSILCDSINKNPNCELVDKYKQKASLLDWNFYQLPGRGCAYSGNNPFNAAEYDEYNKCHADSKKFHRRYDSLYTSLMICKFKCAGASESEAVKLAWADKRYGKDVFKKDEKEALTIINTAVKNKIFTQELLGAFSQSYYTSKQYNEIVESYINAKTYLSNIKSYNSNLCRYTTLLIFSLINLETISPDKIIEIIQLASNKSIADDEVSLLFRNLIVPKYFENINYSKALLQFMKNMNITKAKLAEMDLEDKDRKMLRKILSEKK